MKEINLTKGYVTFVDDADYDYLMQWSWHARIGTNTQYAYRSFKLSGKNNTIGMHRQILGITDPLIFGDHKDGNGLNNQRYNLRIATKSQNTINRPSKIGASSVFRGVTWDCNRGKWIVCIKSMGKTINIGRFSDEMDAAKAYNEAAIKYHGEFAKLNVITNQII